MVQHEHNGYLATYKSAESFTDGMEWIIKHPDQKLIQQQARQKIMDVFSEEVIAQKHIRLYESLLQKEGPHV